jgi:hypothetical protein
MNKKVIAGIVLLVVIATVAFVMFGGKKDSKSNSTNTSTTNTTSTQSNNTPAAATDLTSDSMTPSFTITANDDSADHETVTVKKGAKVNLTFAVEKSGVYHGGLQFKSDDPQIDSGPIAPGDSKTVTFTADKSFSFTPYWYASGVKKNYMINVTVQ